MVVNQDLEDDSEDEDLTSSDSEEDQPVRNDIDKAAKRIAKLQKEILRANQKT